MSNKARKKQIILIRIKNVVGTLYLPKNPTKQAIIYCKGGPSFGDQGDSPLWPIARKNKLALFIPDYIGYCRSYGKFSFRNCIKTIEESESFLSGKTKALIPETNKILRLSCKEIFLVGSSWGGSMVPFLEKYRKSKIKHIVMIKPVTDWTSQGRVKYKEEKTADTSQFIEIGLENIYRGYRDSEWPDIFSGNSEEFNPIKQLSLLTNKQVYLYHGKKDISVNWRKSERYYKEFRMVLPKSKIVMKIFDNLGHGPDMTKKAFSDAIRQIRKLETDKKAGNKLT